MEKILLVEDNAPLCWLIERMLRGRYVVKLINSTLDAAAWLDDGNDCDMIITDLEMPEMSGIELIKFVRHRGLHNQIPILVLSGDEPMTDECLKAGADAFIIKPVDPHCLIEQIKKCFHQPAKEITK